MNSRQRRLLTGAAAVLATVASAAAQTAGTWIGNGGSWSAASNWQNSSIPNNGGTANFGAIPFSTTPLVVTNDLTSLSLSQINFNTHLNYQVRAGTASGVGTITLTGSGVINVPFAQPQTLGFTPNGHHLEAPINGSAGLVKRGPGAVELSGYISWYTGGTRIEGGVITSNSERSFGDASGSITFDGGTLRVTESIGWVTFRPIQLAAGGGTIDTTATGTTLFNSSVSGLGALNKIGRSRLGIGSNSPYTGATNVLAGTLGLGTEGVLSATSAINVRGAVGLDNFNTNNPDRIHDNAPVALHGANLTLTGVVNGDSSETLGTTSFSRGTSIVSISPSAGQSATLTFARVSREIGGTAFVRGAGLGSAPGTPAARVYFNTPPAMVGGDGAAGTTNVSIIPWMLASDNQSAAVTAATTSFATYGAGGVRPLNVNTEYATTLASAGASDNVRLTAAETVNAPKAINSLIIAANSSPLSGSSTLTINSGGLMNLSSATINTNLDFGNREGIVFAQGALRLNGIIGGSGGVTKQGGGAATFAAANTYSGPTVVGCGTTFFNTNITDTGAPSPFGTDTSPIVLAPAGVATGFTTAHLAASGGSVSFDRNLHVSARVVVNGTPLMPAFGINGAGTLIMNGDIYLDSSPLSFASMDDALLILNGNISGFGVIADVTNSASGRVRLSGNNTFSGHTEIGSTNGFSWEIGSDSAFGTGMINTVGFNARLSAVNGARIVSNSIAAVHSSSRFWEVAGNEDITFTGDINLSGSYTHQISNTGVTTYAGELHSGGFTKGGTGVLVLRGSNTYTGVTTVSSGVLRVTHANALGSSAVPTVVAIANGAALEILGGTLSNEPLTLAGTGIGNAGVLRSVGGNNSFGDLNAGSDALVAVTIDTLSVGNVLGSGPITKIGAGGLSARRYRNNGVIVQDGTAAVRTGRSTDKTSVVALLTIGSGARFDLGDNDLIVNYTAASPIGTIQNLVATGYADGSWTGTGLTSSAAASQTATALGFAEASDVFTSFPATFSGQSVDNTSVLIRYTIKGDANLDGSANISDFALLAANFNATGSTWYRGDFNYDGTTNISDFALLAANFNLSQPNDLPRGASVPEASSIAILAAVALQGRRRRRA